MWRPTNASKAQLLQMKKMAVDKKRRQADKKRTKKGKVDEVTRVLGPMQQPPPVSKTGAGKKTKAMKMKKRKGVKGSQGGKKGKTAGKGRWRASAAH